MSRIHAWLVYLFYHARLTDSVEPRSVRVQYPVHPSFKCLSIAFAVRFEDNGQKRSDSDGSDYIHAPGGP